MTQDRFLRASMKAWEQKDSIRVGQICRAERESPRPAPVMPWSMSPWVHRTQRCSWLHMSVTNDIYIIHCRLWPHLFTAAPLAGLVLS